MTNATVTTGIVAPAPVLTPRREVWLSLRSNRGAMAALIVILLLVLCALTAPLIAPNDPVAQDVNRSLLPPAWDEGGVWQFPLGTDSIGRCILSRIIYGSRLSLLIASFVILVNLSVDLVYGLLNPRIRGRR